MRRAHRFRRDDCDTGAAAGAGVWAAANHANTDAGTPGVLGFDLPPGHPVGRIRSAASRPAA